MCLDSTVFLIDDDAAVRDALSISLSMSGLKIEVYSSGKAFLDIYNENRPGCLLINLSQPDMGGLAVQQELIRRNFSIPIIYMTEIGSIRNSVSAVQSGCFLLPGETFSQVVAARKHPRSNGTRLWETVSYKKPSRNAQQVGRSSILLQTDFPA